VEILQRTPGEIVNAFDQLTTESTIHRSVYTSPTVYAAELEQIWKRTWLLAGHEAELPAPGSFKTTLLGDQPVIVVRDQSGGLRVLLNSCRHRGALVCRDKAGTKARFQCLYHAWSYGLDGTLLGITDAAGYVTPLSKADLGLWALPRVETYRGIIFASFDPEARPLLEHLGPAARAHLDDVFSTDDIEVIGLAEYEYRGNWKLHPENTIDGYHPRFLHRIVGQTGSFSVGQALDLERGHGVLAWKNALKSPSAEENTAVATNGRINRAMVVFPNMALVNINDFINLRMVIPLAHDRTQISALALGFRSDSPELRRRRATQLAAFQGPAGIAGADDVELFEAAQEGFAANAPAIGWLDISRGLGRPPGTEDLEDETAVRGYYREWRRLMQ
jgi:phenylpropionate dioxygenase-like ring-hydroxylating dioxygenase large terminal subunit